MSEQPPIQATSAEHKKNWYEKHYKKLLIITLILIFSSVAYLYQFNAKNNDLILKDVSLTGGTTITVFNDSINIEDLKSSLRTKFPDLEVRGISDIRSGKQTAFSIETVANLNEVKPALEQYLGYGLDDKNSSIEFSGSSISAGFYKQLRLAVLIAFVFMAIVVFAIFRTPVPSLAVIVSAFADIIMTIVVVDLIGMRLSTAGIIAILMLIGYSVDTDILLTSRLLKSQEGTVNQRLKGAFKTGMTMTVAAIAAVLVAFIVVYNLSDVLGQMFSIILIGLGFDIFNTWVTNASLLKWYMEAKKLT